ncbi:MAG: NAD(P)-binding domain-containing protein [Bacteroidota bacterium]
MQIGIIGSGNIGGTLAQLLVGAGHDVALSNSRGPDSLADQVAALGNRARATTPEEAARFGEVVIEAIPYGKIETLPAEALAETILVSASNYYPGRDGRIEAVEGVEALTQTERVAHHASEARVVKAFNTIYWIHLRDQGDPSLALEDRRILPLASDDEDAKVLVADLIRELGFAPYDMGLLRDGGAQMQPGQPIYNKDITLREIRDRLGLG